MDALLSTKRRALLIGAAGATLLAGCARAARDEFRLSGTAMGTSWHVKLAHAPQRAGLLAAVSDAFERVEQRMSLFRSDSELARFNAHRTAAPFALSAELHEVLAAAQEVSALSRGAFDVTIAPLVQSWGFGPDGRRAVPDRVELAARRGAVDYRALRLDNAARTATKANAALSADLNGIAKGYGVDLVAQALDAHGLEHYMVEAGGEVRAHGVNGDGRAWQIGIERPDAWPQRAHYVAPLADRAMATSGDYRIYFEHGGRRYSHEIDPVRAEPVDHGLASVTVVANDCMRADALATALIVLGPEAGYRLAQARGIAAYFIERRDGRLVDRMTAAFAALGGRRVEA